MQAQEIFDKAVGGVIRQKNLSTPPGSSSCLYRSEDGLACAVGQLVDDKLAKAWDANIEVSGTAIHTIHEIFENTEFAVPTELVPHLNLLDDLQSAHDDAADLHEDADARLLEFVAQAGVVAKDYGLVMHFTDESVAELLA